MTAAAGRPAGPPDLVERTLEIGRRCREAHLGVTQGRMIDVFRALRSVDWLREDDVRAAMRANLAASREEEIIFDRVFDACWRGTPERGGPAFAPRTELVRGDLEYGAREAHREWRTDPGHFGHEEVTRDLNLAARWDAEGPPLEPIIRALARHLATRPSRRMRHAPRGRRVDLRRSIRQNLGRGMDLVELARTARATRKTRIVMLCDVSGSMDAFNPFLLRLMLGLQRTLGNSRTVVFSTRATDITTLLRRRSVAATLREVGATVRHWSGGTDIGGAIAALNRGVLATGAARSTVVIIVSDGYDNGNIETIRREMRALRRRARTIVWINPMYGAQTFTVRAAGMKAALPYVHHFLPAFDGKSLRTLTQRLARI